MDRQGKNMDDLKKAQELTNQFIRLELNYRQSKNPDIFHEMKNINKQYGIANGGGDLFSLYQSYQPVRIRA